MQYRTHAKLAAFYAGLSRITAKTWRENQKIWEERANIDVAPELEKAALLAASLPPTMQDAGAPTDSLEPQLQAVAEATLGLDREELLRRAQDDAFEGQQKNITIQDPLVFRGLERHHREALQNTGAPTGLSSVLFSPCAETLAPVEVGVDHHPYRCLEGSLLSDAKLGLETLGAIDDAQLAREFVRTLDKYLDQWKAQLSQAPNGDGRQLLADLQLLEIYRAQTLIGLAERALGDSRPRQALSFVQLAQNMRSPREIGPINSPLLFALLAEANLSTGRFREALEPLEILSRSFPEVTGLDETVGDLSVLSSINRQGDSKEL